MSTSSTSLPAAEYIIRFETAKRFDAGPNTAFIDFFNEDLVPSIKTDIPTNVGFGHGQESRTLYITAGKSLYRIRVNKQGYHLPPRTR